MGDETTAAAETTTTTEEYPINIQEGQVISTSITLKDDATFTGKIILDLSSTSDSTLVQNFEIPVNNEDTLSNTFFANANFDTIRVSETDDTSDSSLTNSYSYWDNAESTIDVAGFSVNVNVAATIPPPYCEPQNHDVPVAYMGTDLEKLEAGDVEVINFQPMCIDWCDFIKIFYHCKNDFKVHNNLPCKLQKLIAFNLQREECLEPTASVNYISYCLPFNLKQKVIDVWSAELKEKDNCKTIDRCSYMKLYKELSKLNTLADMDDFCNFKMEAISRTGLVNEIVQCFSNPRDHYRFTISAQINPKNPTLTPILLNFQYEVIFPSWYFVYNPTNGYPTGFDYNIVLCPPKCECCLPKFKCKEECPCLPPAKH